MLVFVDGTNVHRTARRDPIGNCDQLYPAGVQQGDDRKETEKGRNSAGRKRIRSARDLRSREITETEFRVRAAKRAFLCEESETVRRGER